VAGSGRSAWRGVVDGRRLVWTIVDGPYSHHNGSAQVLGPEAGGGDGDHGGGATLVWVTDLLPDETAGPTAAMMERGLAAVKETLEG
jgi:hypothetical protein